MAELLCAQRGQRLTPIRRKVLAVLLATVACVHNHSAAALVVFLICECCGAVGEASSEDVTATLTSAARAAGFMPKSPVIEVTGICAHCREG